MGRLKLTKLLQSWQIFYAVKEELGLDYLCSLWGYRNARHIQRWCADPRRAMETAPNPIDKLQLMLEDLNKFGHREIALAAIKCLAKPLNFEVKDTQALEPEKETLQEFLDVVQAIGNLAKETQQALSDGILEEEEALSILDFVDIAIKELMQFRNAIKLNREEGCPRRDKGASL